MEKTPSRTKSATRLSKLRHYSGSPIPKLSLEIVVPSSPNISTPPSTISPTLKPPYTLPLHDFLMFSPSASPSSLKRSKTRRLEMADDSASAAAGGAIEAFGLRKRCKSRNSPRSNRRSRRRTEQDLDKDLVVVVAGGDEISAKPRKKRHIEKSTKAKSPGINDCGDGYNLDAIGEVLNDLVMWKDVSKSSLWFGFGSLCFLSSCFAKGVNFSIFSFLSQVGLLLLGVSFFSNSMRPKDASETNRDFKLKDDDILRVARLIMPAANLAISKTRRVFSGEPAMTLKVVPFLLVGAEYGHLINLWRLCALGFFISFTGPKLYSAYSSQLSKKVEYVKSWAMDVWGSCTHKKIASGLAATAFWNLTSIRTRVFAAFLCLVILRYRRQHTEAEVEEDAAEAEGKREGKQEQQQNEKALVAVQVESKK
ncbi:hypothetical protein ABFS83_13G033000 [Erythranthe nasuta]